MKSIPLRRWIQGARNDSGSSVLSSAYLACSLRIAISLTEQVGDAEELSAVGLSNGLVSLPPPFPVSCIDWADCVTVTLKSSEALRAGSGSQVQVHVEGEKLEDLLDLIIRDAAEEERQSTHHKLNRTAVATEEHVCVDTDAELVPNYLQVECAQIANEGIGNDYEFHVSNSDDHVDTPKAKLQRIYSVGLVLFELFSGGELPPPDLLLVSSSNMDSLISMSAQEAERQNLGHTYNGQAITALDFGKSLLVSDGHEVKAEDCISRTGTLNLENQLQCDDTIDAINISSISNRRHSVDSGPTSYARNSDYSSRSKRLDSQSLCSLYFEFLKSKGVPRSLCELVHNMIDCINGDFMTNDSYTEMSQVTNDLQLMIDKPSIFLHDLDCAKLSLTGLELDDNVFVRDHEFASIQGAYQRSLSGSPELAIITGMPGTGKSTIANRFGDFISVSGGLFLRGKFDQMQQVKPLSAVTSAFDSCCHQLTREEESKRAIFVIELKAALGTDLYYLIQMIPNLRKIIQVSANDTPSYRDCVNAQERLQYLFCRFVEVISNCLSRDITLFMDDVQWADSASFLIIGRLLKTLRSMKKGKFFFLGSCRDNEMESDHSFWKMIEDVSAVGFNTTTIKLDCVEKDTVNEALSNLLHLSPRLVRSLSEIVYHKTKGNPLFFSRMLLALNREGLLRISLTRQRWEWDEEKIQSRKLPEDVALLFINRISMLPESVKVALGTLSCFGASVDCDVIHAIESDLALNLIEPLNVAISEGLVNKLDGRYHFCHDLIQEAVYSMIDEQDCLLHHNKYGLSLMDRSLKTGNAGLLFTAITQVNLGGPSAVQDVEQYSMIVNYNLIAGKNAMEMSDFSSAFSFLDHGMKFFQENHWRDHYDLSLELFNLAAKCALAIKNLNGLSMICDEILKNARNFEDTLHASLIAMSALTHSMISESVTHGMSLLSKLDIDIPGSCSQVDSLSLIVQTQSMLGAISDKVLLDYRLMTDYRKMTAMKVLAKLEHSIFQVKPALQPWVTVEMVRLTVEHGLSPMSAIGFAYFGGMVAGLGDIRGGYRFTRLAKMLVDKIQCNEIAGEVIWISTESLSFIEPLQTVNEFRMLGQSTAMAAGDIHWACWNKASYCMALFWCGMKLSVTKETIIRTAKVCFSINVVEYVSFHNRTHTVSSSILMNSS
eukprot:CCRYP_006657-RA/>CCRYP_006657-RA protein AED:0.02 eAED:0.02 QI:170/1/1/1/1/0.75/4/900/1170